MAVCPGVSVHGPIDVNTLLYTMYLYNSELYKYMVSLDDGLTARLKRNCEETQRNRQPCPWYRFRLSEEFVGLCMSTLKRRLIGSGRKVTMARSLPNAIR